MDVCTMGARFLTAITAAALMLTGGESPIAGRESKPDEGSSPADPGMIVYYQDLSGRGEIFTVRPDGSEPRRLTRWRGQDLTPALSPDGSGIAWCSDRDGDVDLYVMASDGSEVVRLTTTPEPENAPDWSPDGERIAFASGEGADAEIVVLDLGDGRRHQLTDNGWTDQAPSWSPDGRSLAFSAKPDGNHDLFVMPADGGEPRRLTTTADDEFMPRWSPDGSSLLYSRREPDGSSDLWRLTLADGSATRLTDDPAVDEDGAWSPDGAHIVFQSNRSGLFRLYTMAADGSDVQPLTVGTGGAFWPRWGPLDPIALRARRSAAAEVERALAAGDSGAALALLTRGEAENLDIDEPELNALGYRLLESRRIADGVAVLAAVTELFPESWNAWDSLGEASLWADDVARAERCYTRSIELEPGNDNGRRQLSRIHGARLDTELETTAAPIFAAGTPTGLDGPYLGQEPPGTTPRVFAPGIVSTTGAFEFSITFTPDGRELYFTRRFDPGGQNTIMVSRWTEGGWTAPEPAAFALGIAANEPHVTPDGRLLYFGAAPPSGPPGPGIWVSERSGDDWGEPRFVTRGMYASATLAGDLYVMEASRHQPVGLVRLPRTADGFGPPESLGPAVNEPGPGVHGFITPDGSTLVFDSYTRPGAQGGEGDLFVTVRREDGSWGPAVNLGDTVNTPATNFCPSLSPDGKYLFFGTHRDIYWVSAEVLAIASR